MVDSALSDSILNQGPEVINEPEITDEVGQEVSNEPETTNEVTNEPEITDEVGP